MNRPYPSYRQKPQSLETLNKILGNFKEIIYEQNKRIQVLQQTSIAEPHLEQTIRQFKRQENKDLESSLGLVSNSMKALETLVRTELIPEKKSSDLLIRQLERNPIQREADIINGLTRSEGFFTAREKKIKENQTENQFTVKKEEMIQLIKDNKKLVQIIEKERAEHKQSKIKCDSLQKQFQFLDKEREAQYKLQQINKNTIKSLQDQNRVLIEQNRLLEKQIEEQDKRKIRFEILLRKLEKLQGVFDERGIQKVETSEKANLTVSIQGELEIMGDFSVSQDLIMKLSAKTQEISLLNRSVNQLNEKIQKLLIENNTLHMKLRNIFIRQKEFNQSKPQNLSLDYGKAGLDKFVDYYQNEIEKKQKGVDECCHVSAIHGNNEQRASVLQGYLSLSESFENFQLKISENQKKNELVKQELKQLVQILDLHKTHLSHSQGLSVENCQGISIFRTNEVQILLQKVLDLQIANQNAHQNILSLETTLKRTSLELEAEKKKYLDYKSGKDQEEIRAVFNLELQLKEKQIKELRKITKFQSRECETDIYFQQQKYNSLNKLFQQTSQKLQSEISKNQLFEFQIAKLKSIIKKSLFPIKTALLQIKNTLSHLKKEFLQEIFYAMSTQCNSSCKFLVSKKVFHEDVSWCLLQIVPGDFVWITESLLQYLSPNIQIPPLDTFLLNQEIEGYKYFLSSLESIIPTKFWCGTLHESLQSAFSNSQNIQPLEVSFEVSPSGFQSLSSDVITSNHESIKILEKKVAFLQAEKEDLIQENQLQTQKLRYLKEKKHIMKESDLQNLLDQVREAFIKFSAFHQPYNSQSEIILASIFLLLDIHQTEKNQTLNNIDF